MSMFHLSTKPIKRSDGRSATASAAYRSAEKISDKRTGLTHDYSKKTGVVETNCFTIIDGQKVDIDRSELWNAAEGAEKRKDGRTAREIIINLPHEMTKEQRGLLVYDFTKDIAKKYNVAVDYAIHSPDKHGDQRNHHCHIMVTTRTATLENDQIILGKKTNIELSNTKLATLDLPKTQTQITNLRQHWAKTVNKHLAHANINKRIDHRSHADRNIDKIPTIKLGWEASALERKGIATAKGDINRAIKIDNQLIDELECEISFLQDERDIEIRDAEQVERIAFEKAQAPTPTPKPVAAPEPEPEPTRPTPQVAPIAVHTPIPDIELSDYLRDFYEGLHKHHDKIMNRVEDDNLLNIAHDKNKFFDNAEQFSLTLSNSFEDKAMTRAELDNIDIALSAVSKIMRNIDDIESDPVPQRDSAVSAFNDVCVKADAMSSPAPEPTQSSPSYPTPYDQPSTPFEPPTPN